MNNKIFGLRLMLFIAFSSGLFSISAQDFKFPFSRYGMGYFKEQTYVTHQSMGYAATGWMDSVGNGNSLQNPASLANNLSFSFDGGIGANIFGVQSKDQTYNNTDYGIQYLSFSIPLWKKYHWGLNINVQQVSQINYSIKSGTPLDTQYWNGSGGFNKYTIGSGVKVFKGLYAGLNLSYYYGRDELHHDLEFTEIGSAAVETRQVTSGGGLALDLGLLYQLKLNNNRDRLGIGIDFQPQGNFTAGKDIISYNYYPDYNYGHGDTIEIALGKTGKFTKPMQYSFGLSYLINQKLLLLADYKFIQMSKYQLLDKVDLLNDQQTFAAGFQYNPIGTADDNARFNAKYTSKILYRGGFQYTKTYYNINGYQPNQVSVTGGLGFPIGVRGNRVDLGLEVGQIGNKTKSEVQFQYFKISIGLHMYDLRWFEHRREL